MSLTTTKSIMDYVKDFLEQAADEEWDHDFMIESWNEKEKDIKELVDANMPKKTKKESSPKDPANSWASWAFSFRFRFKFDRA